MTGARGYLDGLPFSADRFQYDAAAAIDRGESVVVTAPTGAGKTAIAEAAIARAHQQGLRAMYTTPLKALSNQKFGDFRGVHGDAAVGLLTGDNSINGTAPIVVMTTEVLRNMMYAASPDLADIGVAILDEVHYLQDRARGAVWEEIIIHLDRSIPLVCLSATIANPEEFAAWVTARRGPTSLVVERTRPVPLDSEYLIKDRWDRGELHLMGVFDPPGRPSQQITKLLRKRAPRGKRFVTPRRYETVELLRGRGLLPAIYFIFSRVGCDAASQQVVDSGLRLTTTEEAATIRAAAEQRVAHLDPHDLSVVGYDTWLRALEAGVAPHHAGMIPAFKETVEHLFGAGLVRLVFATETLSLGINMPARTVVLENLSKFTGDGHELLQPGDYTQLTGRAGRRGIDELGTAVVLYSQYVPFERVAAIAGTGAHPLRSSFAPTYNMVANLIATYPRPTAEELLNSSFAQFHEDERRRQLELNLQEARSELRGHEELARCEYGPIDDAVGPSGPSLADVMAAFAARLGPGDILRWTDRGEAVHHVVVARGRGSRPRLMTVTPTGELRQIAADRIPAEATRIGRLDLPEPYAPREQAFRDAVLRRLEAETLGGEPELRPDLPAGEPADAGVCPDLDRHRSAARAARRTERRIERLRRLLAGSAAGLVPQLRSIRGLLESWGYAEGWSLTPTGERLRFIYNELDLLLAESLGEGLFDGLEPAELAALASAFTFEPRAEVPPDRWPSFELAERADGVAALWNRLADDEAAAGLPQSRPPEAGFAELAYRWASGDDLQDLFEDEGGSVGDFVRNSRQLIDLLRQIRDVAPEHADGAAAAARLVDRGVVAAAGAV